MPPDRFDDSDALPRYLAGECTPAEAREIETRLTADPELRAAVRALRQTIVERRAELRDGSVDAAAALVEIRARVAARDAAPVRRVLAPSFTVSPRGGSRWAWPTRVAAAVLVAAGVAAGARAVFVTRAPATAEIPERTASTGPAQRATFQLPDGTQVMLGVASRLRYRVGATGPRDVALEGEAYFDVVHDERRPFVVRAGDLVAEDYGTQFVIRAYPEDAHARVVVREGKVAIAGRVLEPGQLGRLSAAGVPVVEAADTALHFAWTTGTLVLDGTPLRDALPQLGRWFDLEFRLADDALGRRTIAATLTNQPTDDALASLAAALGLRVSRRGRVVTFSETAATRPSPSRGH